MPGKMLPDASQEKTQARGPVRRTSGFILAAPAANRLLLQEDKLRKKQTSRVAFLQSIGFTELY